MTYLGYRSVVMIALITLIAGFPLGRPSPKPDTLLGLAPGSSMSDVRAKIGDPLMTRFLPDGSQVSWNRSPSDDAYITLADRDGLVSYIRVIAARVGIVNEIADPFGVMLGGNQLGLRTLRGKPQSTSSVGADQIRQYPGPGKLHWMYTIRGDEVHAITLATSGEIAAANPMPKTIGSAPTLPPSKMTDPRDGFSTANAFLINARDEDEGTRFEQFFVKTLPGCAQIWTINQRSRVLDRKRHYDKMELACGDSGNTRLAFFDITSFFGKVVLPTEIP